MIKLIASDLDGTIIDKNNQINEENFKAINMINSNGLDFVVCTGKTYPMVKDTCIKFNAKYGIFGNGNQIIDLKTGKEIYLNLLTYKEAITCINLAKENSLHVHIYTDTDIITENLEYMDLRNYKIHEKDSSINFIIVNNIGNYILNNKIKICQLVISSDNSLEMVRKQILDKLHLSINLIKKRGIYKDYIIDKEYEYLDITPSRTNKNFALSILSKELKISNHEILAIGDNLNDLEMVKHSGIGIAIANSYDELKQVAKYTTKNTVEQGGFAEAIYKFIK